MKKIKVSIITEGSKDLGLGHVYSCLSFYQAFKIEKVDVQIIINGDSSLSELMKGIRFSILNWSNSKNEEILIKKIRGSNVVLVDSLYASKKFYEKISSMIQVPVFMDYDNRFNYPRGIVINRTLNAHKLKYQNKNNIIYLLGTRYFPLTKAFWYAPEKKINKEIKNILITFGGTDLKEMTPKVLQFLNEKYQNINKFVIVGKAFTNKKAIRKYINKNTKLFYHPDGETIKNIMLDSDIAISAGGQTLFELARIGVPTIAITVANNQKYNIDSLQKAGFLEYAGSWNDKEFYLKLGKAIKKLKDYHLRKRKNIMGRNLIDGYGSVRVVNFILGAVNKSKI